MATLDLETIRHALEAARANGLAEVELEQGDARFAARLMPGKARKRAASADVAEEPAGPQTAEIRAGVVGYYREAPKPLVSGARVAPGDVVALISALGIATEVEATVAGEIAEVLVAPGDPVEYGQPLARVTLG